MSRLRALRARHLHSACSLGQRQETTILDVFDRKAKLAQRERAANLPDASKFDYLKEEFGYRLADRVLDIQRKMPLCLDLGSGKGYVARHLTSHSVEKVVALEMSPSMLDSCQVPPDVPTEKILLDEDGQRLPFDDESLDLVTSSLSAHWVNNLPGLFMEVRRILKKDGVFIGSVFGEDTLFELRCSLQMAELEREGGFGTHVSPFIQAQDLGSLLSRSGFTMLTIDSDEIVVGFPTVFELMRDLKGMAENNAVRMRKPMLHRDTLLAADAVYGQLYPHDAGSGRKATFQALYWIGWKPHPSQPKPLKPQASDVSLKDIYKLDEIATEKMSEKEKPQ